MSLNPLDPDVIFKGAMVSVDLSMSAQSLPEVTLKLYVTDANFGLANSLSSEVEVRAVPSKGSDEFLTVARSIASRYLLFERFLKLLIDKDPELHAKALDHLKALQGLKPDE